MTVSKFEIEDAIKNKGDFVKIDYLKRYLKVADNFEVKKYIHLTLADICEQKNMFHEAIKNISSAADMTKTFREKIDLYMKETELNIMLRDFEMADKSMKKAYAFGNSQEKMDIQIFYRELFRKHAKLLEEKGKHRIALELYEKLYSITKNPQRKIELKEKLLGLYLITGMQREYNMMKENDFVV